MKDSSPFREVLRSLPGYSVLRRIYRVGTTREPWARVVMNREKRSMIQELQVQPGSEPSERRRVGAIHSRPGPDDLQVTTRSEPSERRRVGAIHSRPGPDDPPPANLRTLEISGTSWRTFPFRSYKSVHYPDFDICANSLDESFDLIIAEQVFEHLLRPYRAGQNVYQMLDPGGYFLITTQFLMRLENSPVDCSRWTETGLKYFLAECGFDLHEIRTGSWGNRACALANLVGSPSYRPGVHSLKNEPDFPVAVWALARRAR